MKRVKIMLSAVALFAVIGGALAFKANDENDRVQRTFYTINPNNGDCTSVLLLQSKTTSGTGVFSQINTTTSLGACPVIKITADA